MKLSQWLGITALGGIALLAVIGLFYAPGVGTPIAVGLPQACTVGLTGAAVSIQAEGVGAGEACDLMDGWVTDGGDWYRYTGDAQPAGAVICQVQRGSVTYTVRDQGAMNLYGSAACGAL